VRGGWVFGFSSQKTTKNQETIIMSQEFVPEDNSSVQPNNGSAVSEQEIVQITVVGSRKTVLETIHTLYRLGFAAVGDWSKLQRGPKPGQFISVLIKRKA
jgi:hypothetical protein